MSRQGLWAVHWLARWVRQKEGRKIQPWINFLHDPVHAVRHSACLYMEGAHNICCFFFVFLSGETSMYMVRSIYVFPLSPFRPPKRLLLRSLFSNLHPTCVMFREYWLQNAIFSVCIIDPSQKFQDLSRGWQTLLLFYGGRTRTLLPLNWCMRFCQWKMYDQLLPPGFCTWRQAVLP